MILKALSKPFNEGTGHVRPELLAPLVSMAGAVVRDGNLTDLAMLLSAAARLGPDHPPSTPAHPLDPLHIDWQPLLKELESHGCNLMSDMDARDLAHMAWAMARTQRTLRPELADPLFKRAAALLEEPAMRQAGFQPHEVARFLWALAKLQSRCDLDLRNRFHGAMLLCVCVHVDV